MSVLYCTIPYFATALARRDDPSLCDRPLILIGPQGRVLDRSATAAACGVTAGMTTRTAEIRCPEARLQEADLTRCRVEAETLLQMLEGCSAQVEPHGWGAAYVDLGTLIRGQTDAVSFLRDLGRSVRHEMGDLLQPALGWDSTKFTAQTAARKTQPGHMRTVEGMQQKQFLRPLPVTLLPLAQDTVQRLHFLGLRTLGQYASLSPAAVWQQFGQAGKLAHRCARGEDDRPIIPRGQAQQLTAGMLFDSPLTDRAWLLAAAQRLLSPLLARLRDNLQACNQIRLAVQLEDGSNQERERAFLQPVSDEGRVMRALDPLLDGVRWTSAATGLSIFLDQIQDAVAEQLTLFPLQDERQEKLHQVQSYLSTRFGTHSLRRAVLSQPGAPLPEWRVSWLVGGER